MCCAHFVVLRPVSIVVCLFRCVVACLCCVVLILYSLCLLWDRSEYTMKLKIHTDIERELFKNVLK